MTPFFDESSLQQVDKQHLGEIIMLLRTRHQLHLSDFATKTDMAIPRLYQIETGEALPTLEELTSIASHIDMEPGHLIFLAIPHVHDPDRLGVQGEMRNSLIKVVNMGKEYFLRVLRASVQSIDEGGANDTEMAQQIAEDGADSIDAMLAKIHEVIALMEQHQKK